MLKSVSFEVTGEQRIFCESCEQRIQKLLKAVEGVKQVRAQSRNQRVEVMYDTATLDATAIVERLSQAGYETRVQS